MKNPKQKVLEHLEKLDISYEIAEHKAVFTSDEAKNIKIDLAGVGCKTLFLTDRKGRYFLVLIPDIKRLEVKIIKKLTNSKDISFTSAEELLIELNLTPGSVTPFGIINAQNKDILILLDKYLEGQTIQIHPNINTASVALKFEDLIKFIENFGFKYITF